MWSGFVESFSTIGSESVVALGLSLYPITFGIGGLSRFHDSLDKSGVKYEGTGGNNPKP